MADRLGSFPPKTTHVNYQEALLAWKKCSPYSSSHQPQHALKCSEKVGSLETVITSLHHLEKGMGCHGQRKMNKEKKKAQPTHKKRGRRCSLDILEGANIAQTAKTNGKKKNHYETKTKWRQKILGTLAYFLSTPFLPSQAKEKSNRLKNNRVNIIFKCNGFQEHRDYFLKIASPEYFVVTWTQYGACGW